MKNSNQNFKQKPNRYMGKPRKKDFYDIFLDKINNNKIKSVLELGCATGDFLYYLPDNIKGTGIDISKVLIKEANKSRKKDNLNFICEDLFKYNPATMPDLVVMTGFLCTFLKFQSVIDKALSLSKRFVFINDFINNFNVDCKYSFRENDEDNFQIPYNIWSKRTISEYLDKKKINYKIEPYIMHSWIKRNKNPLYNFHAKINKKKVLINNGGIILNGCNIFITKDDCKST
jgi:SAM-dependent methyltransferase